MSNPTISTDGNNGSRKLPRYVVRWRIVVVYKHAGKHITFQGNLSDLSLGGASFFSDHNIHSAEPVVATIEIPAYTHHEKNIVVGTRCMVLHSILSSNYGKYRVGLKFIDFKGNGKGVLTEALSKLVAISDNNLPYYR